MSPRADGRWSIAAVALSSTMNAPNTINGCGSSRTTEASGASAAMKASSPKPSRPTLAVNATVWAMKPACAERSWRGRK
jgi:hypothetical protein